MERGRGKESLAKFLDEHPGWIIVDHSQLEQWEQCKRKYEYIYRHGLDKGVNVAGEFSSLLVHHPLSKWYLNGGRVAPTNQEWDTWWLEFNERIGNTPLTNRQRGAYTLQVARQIYNQYTQTHNPDFRMYKIVSSEEIYWATVDGLVGAVWVSKPDLVLQEPDQSLTNADFKQSIYDFNVDLIQFDNQFLGQAYVIGAKHMMKNFAQIILDRSYRPQEVRLNRSYEPVDADLMEEWIVELRHELQHLVDSVAKGIYRKSAPKACTDFNHACPFNDLCPLGRAREVVMDTRERVNPLEYLGL